VPDLQQYSDEQLKELAASEDGFAGTLGDEHIAGRNCATKKSTLEQKRTRALTSADVRFVAHNGDVLCLGA
jgi:hypothetical protein